MSLYISFQSLGLDNENVSRVNPIYQDAEEGVYGIHNTAAESFPGDIQVNFISVTN